MRRDRETTYEFDGNRLTLPVLILGGGFNILFTKNFEGTVLKIAIKGIETVKEDADNVYIKEGDVS